MSDSQRIDHWFRFLSWNIKCNINTSTVHWLEVNQGHKNIEYGQMGVRARRTGSQSNKVRQLNNLWIFIFDSSDWHCLIFFRIMDERATRMGERARLMAVNQDMRCDLIFYKGCLRYILNWSRTLSAFVVALSKKCVGYADAETFQPFCATFFPAVLWFLLHWFLCCGDFLTAIPLSSPLEAWTQMLAQN